MVDLHSHILPNVDDGSRSVQESLQLLTMLAEQGVSKVAATPHFSADRESVDDFIRRRQISYETLSKEVRGEMPEIVLGAEVKYYQGISRMADLKKLCIEGSNLFLLEMPMVKWTEYVVKELLELSCSRGITLVLAHIERYLRLQPLDVWERLLNGGVLMQVNATFFTDFRTRRKAVSLLKNSSIHFLGSDCHRAVERPPYIKDAVEIIEKKMGSRFLALMTEYANSMFV
ncbi:MAG: capsular polysaccharide biosynthesis protein [Clostridia bacterium]|nr:capsular polysaccharide biosynthesis protein [Clostridia bacterium]